jgi:hypothetical protein
MRKLRLELEELTVETFETVPARAGRRGTVQGAAYRIIDTDVCDTAAGCANTTPNCPDTDACPDTGIQQCGYSYGGTCGASPPDTYYAGCFGGAELNVAPLGDSPFLCV